MKTNKSKKCSLHIEGSLRLPIRLPSHSSMFRSITIYKQEKGGNVRIDVYSHDYYKTSYFCSLYAIEVVQSYARKYGFHKAFIKVFGTPILF